MCRGDLEFSSRAKITLSGEPRRAIIHLPLGSIFDPTHQSFLFHCDELVINIHTNVITSLFLRERRIFCLVLVIQSTSDSNFSIPFMAKHSCVIRVSVSLTR